MERKFFFTTLLLIFFIVPCSVHAAVSVNAAVERQNVYVGEPFLFQVQVEGHDSPQEPDLSHLKDFTITPQGGQQNNSQSITIINGKMTKVSRHGYIFNYKITAKNAGRLSIPALRVMVDGRAYSTKPVTIHAQQPKETNDFKLRLKLEEDHAFVGQPIKMTVTWYVGTDVKDFQFNIPLLSDPRFTIRKNTEAFNENSQQNLVRVLVAGHEFLALKGTEKLDGKEFLTVTFSLYVFAKEPGKITIPQATVTSQALTGYRQRNADPFSDGFGGFFGQSRGVYRTVVVPSNEPQITVEALPSKGQPGNFTGLVGEYSIAVSANPMDVKVGDPITLTIQVAGPFVNNVDLSFLRDQLPDQDFKVPDEMAPGVSEGILKTFTQTVRARHSDITEIPSITMPYFRPSSRRYELARSKPVGINVKGAKLITAEDAEGTEVSSKKEIKAVQGGINFNYEGADLLETNDEGVDSLVKSWVWYVMMGLPIAIYLICLIKIQVNTQRNRDPGRRIAKKALRKFIKVIAKLPRDNQENGEHWMELGDALRTYLGAKMQMNAASIIYADVEGKLLETGVDQDILSRLRSILDRCEAYRYAGKSAGEDFNTVVGGAVQVIKHLDTKI